LYGYAGVGKTTCAIQFPQPYLIDTERGAENDQYVKMLNDRGGAIFQTGDFDEMLAEVTSLLTEKHDYRTLVIDPLTVVYDDLLSKAEKQVGSEFGRHYGEANKRMKHLLNLLTRLDMNVIITCHAKKEYGENMSVKNETFDGYKKLDYLFDLVFFIQKMGEDRVARIRKSRVEGFAEGEMIPFNYAEVAERYGRDVIERTATPEELASAEQVAEMRRLIDLLKTPQAVVEKWLDKAKAERLDELPADSAAKVIAYLNNQVSGKAVAV
jgi:hypothetical protein